MRAQLLAALRAVLVFTVLVGVAYPLAVTGVAQLAFGDQADGSLIERDGVVVG
ncbi:MAG TPA: potassium-transporting ATPase subunit C, partial [Actinomycetota bacterium]